MSEQLPSQNTAHIVIVEDEDILRQFLTYHVEHTGYRATPVATGTEMMAVVEREPVDLILMDLGLPDGDGLSWAQKLKESGNIPIVVLTGRTGDDDRIMALGLGADDYLTKPCDPRELLLRIRNILERTGTAAAVPAPPMPGTPETAPVPAPAPQRSQSTPGERQRRQEDRRSSHTERRHEASSDGPKKPLNPAFIITGVLALLAGGGATWFLMGGFDTATPAKTGSVQAPTIQQGLNPPQKPQAKLPPSERAGASQPPAPSGAKPSATPAPETSASTAIANDEKSETLPPSSSQGGIEQEPQTDRPVASTSYAWVMKSKCQAIPDVAWWRVKNHTDIVRYVNRRHFGDWLPYIKSWMTRLAKLKEVRKRNSGIKTKTGEVLRGPSLSEYIDNTAKRLTIVKCLSREAADYAFRRSQIKK